MHKYRYMKDFLSHIGEAVARPKTRSRPVSKSKKKTATTIDRAEFQDRWHTLMRGVGELDNLRAKVAVMAPWRLTGHVGADHTNDEIERVKERVFGKIGSSEIIFFTAEHGIISFPAEKNLTHSDIEANTSLASRLDPAKMRMLNSSTVLGRGRVQHGAVGMVAFYPRSDYRGRLGGMIRTISRAYPGYQIHDGSGNLYEGVAKSKPKGRSRTGL